MAAKQPDLTTERGVVARLAATTSRETWNRACAEIRDANAATPREAGGPLWYRHLLCGAGLYAEMERRWGVAG